MLKFYGGVIALEKGYSFKMKNHEKNKESN